jgi:hypothetical protein
MKPTYQIVIESNGDTTTAKMFVNGKEVKTSTAKRNPNDKHDWKMAANVAFDRLWQKQEKREEKKPDGVFKVGDRVVAHDLLRYDARLNGKAGKVVNVGTACCSVEFDEYVGGHDCHGDAKNGHGWYVAQRCLRHEKPTKPEVREVKRTAKVGEWVKIVKRFGCIGEKYRDGDVLRVKQVDCVGLAYLLCGGDPASPDEYVVLEGYKPEGE